MHRARTCATSCLFRKRGGQRWATPRNSGIRFRQFILTSNVSKCLSIDPTDVFSRPTIPVDESSENYAEVFKNAQIAAKTSTAGLQSEFALASLRTYWLRTHWAICRASDFGSAPLPAGIGRISAKERNQVSCRRANCRVCALISSFTVC